MVRAWRHEYIRPAIAQGQKCYQVCRGLEQMMPQSDLKY